MVLAETGPFQPNRSGLLLAIPYGLPTGIARSHIHISRTVVYKPPYGTSCAVLLPTTVSHIPETVRVCFSHRTGPFLLVVSNDTSEKYRSGLQQTPYGMYVSRLSHHFLGNFSAVFQHEIVLTFEYETLVTLCFSSDFPALALSPPVHTHTVRDFQPFL